MICQVEKPSSSEKRLQRGILEFYRYIQEQIVAFLVENVLYSNESFLSIPCWDGTLYSNKE